MSKYSFTEEDIDLFKQRIETKRTQKYCSMWIIKFFGEVHVTSSGKCGWNRINHAKYAFKLDCSHVAYLLEIKYGYKTYRDSLEIWNNYLDELIKQGIVEFVEIH